MLVINEEWFFKRAEIIWEKGTNRAEFFRGEVNKYGWVDIGSSFLPSELSAAFLYAQLENLEFIQMKRKTIWGQYYSGLKTLESRDLLKLPYLPDYSTNNGHMFYLLGNNLKVQSFLISLLRKENILGVFHYLSLHKSPFFQNKHDGRILPEADRYSECLVRLPLYFELDDTEVTTIVDIINSF